jgi:hypothetical protein
MKNLQVINANREVQSNALVLEVAADGDGAKERLDAQTPFLNQLRSNLTMLNSLMMALNAWRHQLMMTSPKIKLLM